MAKMNHWRAGKLYGRKAIDHRYENLVPDRAQRWLDRAERMTEVRASMTAPVTKAKTNSFDQLLAQLPQLSQQQLRELKGRVDYLIQNGPLDDNEQKADWLTAGMLSELKRRGLIPKYLSYSVVVKVVGYKYSARCGRMRQALLNRVGRPLNTAEQAVLGRIVGRALAEWLSERAPVGLKSLLTNVNNVLAAVEYSFPGYLEARQLRLILDLQA